MKRRLQDELSIAVEHAVEESSFVLSTVRESQFAETCHLVVGHFSVVDKSSVEVLDDSLTVHFAILEASRVGESWGGQSSISVRNVLHGVTGIETSQNSKIRHIGDFSRSIGGGV